MMNVSCFTKTNIYTILVLNDLNVLYFVYFAAMPSCCVPQCPNREDHRFPTRDRELRKLWMAAVKREKWTPTPSSVVRKNHFTEEDYIGITNLGKYFKILAYVASYISQCHDSFFEKANIVLVNS